MNPLSLSLSHHPETLQEMCNGFIIFIHHLTTTHTHNKHSFILPEEKPPSINQGNQTQAKPKEPTKGRRRRRRRSKLTLFYLLTGIVTFIFDGWEG